MKKKILITAALPYANGPLHFGHIAGAYLPADCYARFERIIGNDVLYVCGSDEYGVAITLSAEKANRSPKEHVDIFHKVNEDFFKKLNISFDFFSRTTNEEHEKLSQEFFLDLLKNGYIEEKTENHLYSEKENKFLADRYVLGTCPKCGYEKARGDECVKCGASYEAKDLKNPVSAISGSKLIFKPSKHWYLRFDKFKEKLSSWISKKKWKSNVLQFAKNYIDDLKPRAITRDSTWGVPLPIKDTKGKVLYVWFDAPIGYISITKQFAKTKNDAHLFEKFWLDPDTKLVNFIGKDNIPFHAVFFPAMVMGQNKNYKLVDDLPANEFLLLEKKQFSKSNNWYIDLEKFFKNFDTDQLRYYLASINPENSDSDFYLDDFMKKSNSDLVGKLGNFAHRCLTFLQNNCDGKIPLMDDLEEVDKVFLKKINILVDDSYHAYQNYQLRKASLIMMELSDLANAYFDGKKPWKAKKENNIKHMNDTIATCLYAVKNIALISYPIIPTSANKIWHQLGFAEDISSLDWFSIKEMQMLAGKKLPSPTPVFKKIEENQIQELKMDLNNDKNLPEIKKENLPALESIPSLKDRISYDDFEKLDFRVGLVTQATKIEKSKKLLKLEVDIGFEKRTIVSGIAKEIEIEQIIGKKVIVLANINKTTIMGVESNGMILAANDDKLFEIPYLDSLSPGSIVS
jgi:methionyl-tRNA synthetase